MSKLWAAVIAMALGASALGQSTLYDAVRPAKDQGITLKAWGSGTISETDELAYQGNHSIRVSTRNFFQGGFFSLAKPVDLGAATGDKNNLLRAMIAVSTGSTVYGGRGSGPGGVGGPGGAGGSGGGSRGGRGGGGPGGLNGVGGQPGGGPGTGTSTEEPPLKTMRFVITTTDGLKSEAYVPMPTSATPGKDTFVPVAIPLQAIAGFDKTNKIVQSIGFSGDSLATFYVGDVRVVNDSTPITGDIFPSADRNLALGDEIKYAAKGYGGASILLYQWSFGESGTDVVDAEGQYVTHRFRKPGTFTVTVTFVDKFGLKKSFSRSMKVTVNP